MLKIHADDLPPHLDRVVEESRVYMAQIYSRLSPTPQPHNGHNYLGPWFDGAKGRMRGKNLGGANRQCEKSAEKPVTVRAATVLHPAKTLQKSAFAHAVFSALRAVYRRIFGSFPRLRKIHPLWADYSYVAGKVAEWRKDPAERILWLGSGDSLFHRVLKDRVDCGALLAQGIRGALFEKAPYDVCLCELTLEQSSRLKEFYGLIRPLVKDGGNVIVHVVRKPSARGCDWIGSCGELFPDTDSSEIRFFGTAATATLRACYTYALGSFQSRRLLRGAITGATLLFLAPFVWRANGRAALRDSSIYTPRWTSMVIDFTVRRRVTLAHKPLPQALTASQA